MSTETGAIGPVSPYEPGSKISLPYRMWSYEAKRPYSDFVVTGECEGGITATDIDGGHWSFSTELLSNGTGDHRVLVSPPATATAPTPL